MHWKSSKKIFISCFSPDSAVEARKREQYGLEVEQVFCQKRFCILYLANRRLELLIPFSRIPWEKITGNINMTKIGARD